VNRPANEATATGWRPWLIELPYAIPIVAGMIGLFYTWYAVRDRYFIFLYYHDMGPGFDTRPFGWVTTGRYRMSALVASGAVMVVYLAVHLVLGRASKRFRVPVWWRVWVLCAIPLTAAVPAIVMMVNEPVLSLALAAQVAAVMLVGLALAVRLGRLAAERPLAFVLALIDGGALAALLVFLTAFERYPVWLARGSRTYILVHLVSIGAGITLLAAMTILYVLWRRAPMPEVQTMLVAGLDIGYLLMPLVHHLFFSTDRGRWLDPSCFSYITSADNYFARNAWVQFGTWLVVALIALGVDRLRIWLLSRRGGELYAGRL
jgi:hypothetical protein